jgi:hypothetical protein
MSTQHQSTHQQRPVSDTFTFSMASSAHDATVAKLEAASGGNTAHLSNGVNTDTGASIAHQRPVSEIISKEIPLSSEAEAIDRWFDDLASYEET